jgi:hypothetical protein
MKNRLLCYRDFMTEGLIKTHPISIHKKQLIEDLQIKNINFNLNINYDKELFNITLDNSSFDDVSYVNVLCNMLGYFLTKTTVKKYKNIGGKKYLLENTIIYNSKTFDSDISNNVGLVLFYESKFDKKYKPLTNIIYHATSIKNIEKILKVGLYPSSTSRMEHQIDRIYFCEDLIDCIDIIPKLRLYDSKIKDYVILEIDITDFNQMDINGDTSNVVFYKDSKSNGFYTYHNIPKERIKMLPKIYTQTNNINFDNYDINRVLNPIYLEFFNDKKSVYTLTRKDLK